MFNDAFTDNDERKGGVLRAKRRDRYVHFSGSLQVLNDI